MVKHGIFLALAAAFFGIVSAPAAASAQTGVTILGIRSVEGDDDFARNLTGALRHAAAQVPDWQVSDADISLSQMSLAHGCDEPDAACMAEISGDLDAQRVIYGTVRRTSAGDDYDFALTLYLFDAETGQIARSVTDNVSHLRQDIDDLRDGARRYMARLAGLAMHGSLRVEVEPGDATVSIDGEEAGHADGGVFTATDLSEGRHTIEVTAEGHQSFRASVTVVADQEAAVEAHLEGVVDSGPGLPWPAIGTLTGAGVFAILTIWSMAKINSLGSDSGYQSFRDHVPTSLNACTEARNGSAHGDDGNLAHTVDVCNQADTLEILQYVFLGAAVVAAGVGTWLLLRHDSTETDAQAMALRFGSSFDRHSGHIDATLRF